MVKEIINWYESNELVRKGLTDIKVLVLTVIFLVILKWNLIWLLANLKYLKIEPYLVWYYQLFFKIIFLISDSLYKIYFVIENSLIKVLLVYTFANLNFIVRKGIVEETFQLNITHYLYSDINKHFQCDFLKPQAQNFPS